MAAETSSPFEIYVEGPLSSSFPGWAEWLQRSLGLSRDGTAKEVGTVASQRWFLLPLERRSVQPVVKRKHCKVPVYVLK